MIIYNRSAFGLNLIFRVHGSAVYRSVFPSLVAVGLYLIIRFTDNDGESMSTVHDKANNDEVQHPYALGVLVSSTTFLLVFRANQGYARYWEATGAVHHMMSKWMDATSHMAIYHLQCAHYEDIKPPSYFEYPELDSMYLTRDRKRGFDASESSERIREPTNSKTSQFSSSMEAQDKFHSVRVVRSSAKSLRTLFDERKRQEHVGSLGETRDEHFDPDEEAVNGYLDSNATEYGKPRPLMGKPRLDGNWGKLFNNGDATFCDPQNPWQFDVAGFASVAGGRTPPLFLQELAHLSSLMTAVALATLRNDTDGVESPLDFHEPGSPWPEVDPDKDEALQVTGIQAMWRIVLGFFGVARTPDERLRYTAARPLPVIGGVSDAEIKFLNMARGPYAKTQLCWQWLSEFSIREHLAGSTGKVGPPIISRVIQFLGDGMIHYNHARKVRYIPFPFVHSQISVLFVWLIIPLVALLMDQYTHDVWLGSLLTFGVIMCLAGIDEVARELESPFRNVPNELPLVTLMAQYNEALITMYSGYHPDHFWDGPRALRKGREMLRRQKNANVKVAEAIESAAKNNKAANGISNNNGRNIPPSVQEDEPGDDADAPANDTKDDSNSESNKLDEAQELQRLRRQVEEQGLIIRKLAEQVNGHNQPPAPAAPQTGIKRAEKPDEDKSVDGKIFNA